MSNVTMTMGGSPSLRERLGAFIAQPRVQQVVLALILINAVTLGLETSPAIMQVAGHFIHFIDKAILAVFLAEVGIRLYVHRLGFFRDPWSVFDFVVVGIALVPAAGPFSVLRALRVLRILRVLLENRVDAADGGAGTR